MRRLFTNNCIVLTDIDECASNPCQNLGTCTDGVNQYNCFMIYVYKLYCAAVLRDILAPTVKLVSHFINLD